MAVRTAVGLLFLWVAFRQPFLPDDLSKGLRVAYCLLRSTTAISFILSYPISNAFDRIDTTESVRASAFVTVLGLFAVPAGSLVVLSATRPLLFEILMAAIVVLVLVIFRRRLVAGRRSAAISIFNVAALLMCFWAVFQPAFVFPDDLEDVWVTYGALRRICSIAFVAAPISLVVAIVLRSGLFAYAAPLLFVLGACCKICAFLVVLSAGHSSTMEIAMDAIGVVLMVVIWMSFITLTRSRPSPAFT